MHGMDVFMLKNGTTSDPNTREQPYVYESYSFSTNYFLEI